jgi:hypothetical protein
MQISSLHHFQQVGPFPADPLGQSAPQATLNYHFGHSKPTNSKGMTSNNIKKGDGVDKQKFI